MHAQFIQFWTWNIICFYRHHTSDCFIFLISLGQRLLQLFFHQWWLRVFTYAPDSLFTASVFYDDRMSCCSVSYFQSCSHRRRQDQYMAYVLLWHSVVVITSLTSHHITAHHKVPHLPYRQFENRNPMECEGKIR